MLCLSTVELPPDDANLSYFSTGALQFKWCQISLLLWFLSLSLFLFVEFHSLSLSLSLSLTLSLLFWRLDGKAVVDLNVVFV